MFDTLHSQIIHFQAQGKVLICGDLNARTGSLADYNSDEANNHIFHNSYPSNMVNFACNAFDKSVNKHGKLLMELCKSLGVYLLNGRVQGDSLGRYTYSSSLLNS